LPAILPPTHYSYDATREIGFAPECKKVRLLNPGLRRFPLCFPPSGTTIDPLWKEFIHMSFERMGTKARCASLMLVALAAGSSLFAAANAANHEATYTVGNVDGFQVGAVGFVRVDDAGVMFRTEAAVVDVPYARITGTAISPKETQNASAPAYNVWERLGSKKSRQNLLVNFKDNAGKEQTITLEVSESTVRDIHDTLAVRTQLQASSQEVAKKSATPKAKEPAEAKVKEPAKAKPEAKEAKVKEPKPEPKVKEAKVKEPKVKEPKQEAKAKDPAPAKQQAEAKKETKAKEPQVEAKKQEPAKDGTTEQAQSWWGDSYWKTTRNRGTWTTQSAALGK
jgi:outer membrane biosynthesis protein TonB